MPSRRSLIGVMGIFGLFVAIYLGALAVLAPVVGTGVEPGTDPTDPRFGLLFVGVVLVVSAGMILAFRWGLGWLIRAVILLMAVLLAIIVFDVWIPPIVRLAGFNVLAVAAAIGLGIALAIHPRWYVIDIAGIVLGAGAVALFGMTLGILPVIVLLVLLAVYDAISVYGTKHMLSLAEGAMASRLPVMLIVPVSRDGEIEPNDRDDGFPDNAVIVGLGDAIVPGMLVGSAVIHGPGEPVLLGPLAVTSPALGAIAGISLGVLALFVVLGRGGAHPGLPLLNTGAILGYLTAALLVGISFTEAIGL